MASARNLVTTRCSLPCRPMRWYGPIHGSPHISHLFLRVLDPSICVGICFGSGRLIKSALACFLHWHQPCTSIFLSTQVDKHIRRLDTDLARFEADLKEKQIESSDYDSSSSKGKKSEEGGGLSEAGQGFRGRRNQLFSYKGGAPGWKEEEEGGLNLSFCLPASCLSPLP